VKFILYGKFSLALLVSGTEMGKEDVWMQDRRRKHADYEAITFFAVPRMSGIIHPPIHKPSWCPPKIYLKFTYFVTDFPSS